ncbi:type II toxin-antitoxin system PemK/MazF family toxin [Brevundimonas sp.]|uniref:type II toxin-antitoxin system PemK/MazF family toxin n=1 Tax=Brevundimonas sp. TaxID=1871086 RepID=UPI003A10001E
MPGDHGKPRPAVIVQNDDLIGPETILVCLMTSDINGVADSRLVVKPTPENGLRVTSVVMTEKIYPVMRARVARPIGRLLPAIMDQIDIRLSYVLGLRAS